MKFRYLTAILPMLFTANGFAGELPNLGDVSQATISPRQERELGLQIMSEIRADPAYLDDAEIAGYLTNLGNRLILSSDEAHPDQEFEFFALQDSTINAFALPGGFMGFNSGLILTAQAESELAGVMAHEIAHVTQKHLARMISGQKYSMLTSLVAAALAILASRSNPQAGQAILVGSQAHRIQSQLDFTRAHEKEADRIGLSILMSAGLDPHGMSTFFERLQRAGRFRENGAPSYLRTHPITYERIADIESRIHDIPYRQIPDSLDFQLVRAKLRASLESPREAVEHFDSVLQDKRYSNEAVERYGLINALLRDRKYVRADKELAQLYEDLQSDADEALEHPHLDATPRIAHRTPLPAAMIETLAARARLAMGQPAEALDIYKAAPRLAPRQRPLKYKPADTDETVENHRLGATIQITRKTPQPSAMIETLAARVKLAVGQYAEALDIYKAALRIYPQHRALIYDYADALLRGNNADAALKFVSQQLQFTPNDIRLYRLQAQSYGALGDMMMQHRAQAEVYTRQGKIHAAIEQLQIALRGDDGDFYQKSSAEARLKELRVLAADEKKEN
ncbi:Putative Zn-dependent protease, contains TPR repeats [Nitrosospira sp. Nl5]|uniref:M48 family metalloprotease n=1 Tax=Nitrosospira sp. Nl5 TaxID=200120 RepID=UPI0008831E56|nr:M48 family metalloprotease [Nitrosospira sp. Nl5]SCY16847.1 Putative Zn-dependent protease, contains TPR repeats [Nitrosospira sp. Nl5]